MPDQNRPTEIAKKKYHNKIKSVISLLVSQYHKIVVVIQFFPTIKSIVENKSFQLVDIKTFFSITFNSPISFMRRFCGLRSLCKIRLEWQ